MSSPLLVLLAVQALAIQDATNKTVCEEVRKVIGDKCGCSDRPPYGGDISCEMKFFGDKIGFLIDFEPCAPTPHLDLLLTEKHHNISFPIGDVTYGQPERFAVPGLNIGIPLIGNAGVDVVIYLDGQVNATTLSIGLDACAEVLHHYHCGSKLWHKLPVWLLKHKSFDFSDVCQRHPPSRAHAAVEIEIDAIEAVDETRRAAHGVEAALELPLLARGARKPEPITTFL